MTLVEVDAAIHEALQIMKIGTSELLKVLMERLIRELEEMRKRIIEEMLRDSSAVPSVAPPIINSPLPEPAPTASLPVDGEPLR